MNIGQSIGFIFASQSWGSKVLICGLLLLIPIIGWLLIFGYMIRLLHNVITGEQPTLPEWNQWGADLAGGLKAFVVWFVWLIPAWIIGGISNAIDHWLISLVAIVIGWIITAISISALSDLARTGDFADSFSMKPINRVLNNLVPYAIVLIMEAIFLFLAAFGFILILVGALFTYAIAWMAISHLAGQAYRISEGQNATTPVARF